MAPKQCRSCRAVERVFLRILGPQNGERFGDFGQHERVARRGEAVAIALHRPDDLREPDNVCEGVMAIAGKERASEWVMAIAGKRERVSETVSQTVNQFGQRWLDSEIERDKERKKERERGRERERERDQEIKGEREGGSREGRRECVCM